MALKHEFNRQSETGEGNIILRLDAILTRVTDRTAAGYKPFAEVRSDLQKRMSENIYDKHFSEYVERLRKEAFVKVYDPALAQAEEKAEKKS